MDCNGTRFSSRTFIGVFGLVLLSSCASTTYSGVASLDVPPHQVHRLENGLTVMTVENNARPIIGVTAYVTTGGRTENPHYAGALHFIEHLVFKGGTPRFAPTEFRKRIATLGDENGGWTWDDEIQFGFEVPKEAFYEALDIFVESLLELNFTSDWFESERKVVLQEIEKVSERPWHRVWNTFDEQMFTQHPYRRAVIGTAESVAAQTMQELETYYRERFTPNHLYLTIVGDFDTADLIDGIRRRFLKYAPGPKSFELPERQISEPPFSQLITKRRVFHYGKDGVARLLAGFRTPGAAHPDTAALLVLAEVLDSASHGISASLYRSEPWVSSLGVSHSYMVDHGQFTVRAELSAEKAGSVTSWLQNFLTSLSRESFDAAAVHEAANRVLVKRARRWERFGEQAQELGFLFERMGYDSAVALTSRVLEQTPATLAEVARKYFQANMYVEVLQLPEGSEVGRAKAIKTYRRADPAPRDVQQRLIQHRSQTAPGWRLSEKDTSEGVTSYRLQNGFELLVQPSDASPTLTAVAHVSGGQWVEPAFQAGIGALTMRTLTSGSRHLSVSEWDRTIEAEGLLSSTYVDLGDRSNVNRNVYMRDGSTYSLSGTAQQMPLIVALVGEALYRPIFPQPEVEKARSSLLAEVMTLKNDNLEYIKQEFYRHIFPNHPYGRPTIGTITTLKSLDATAVRAHHARTYAPDRTTLAVVGPVEPAAVLQAVQASMSDISSNALGPLPSLSGYEVPRESVRELSLGRAQRCINFGGPTLSASHDQFEILEVLMTVARGYHFYKYVYDLGVSYRSWVRLWPHRDFSTWIVENDVAQVGFETTLSEIRSDLRRFSEGFATDADVEVARRRLLNRSLLDGQRTLYTAFELARSTVLGRGWKGPARRRAKLKAVTTKQVRAMARDVFGTSPKYEVILR